jgi:hypothetical protein
LHLPRPGLACVSEHDPRRVNRYNISDRSTESTDRVWWPLLTPCLPWFPAYSTLQRSCLACFLRDFRTILANYATRLKDQQAGIYPDFPVRVCPLQRVLYCVQACAYMCRALIRRSPV